MDFSLELKGTLFLIQIFYLISNFDCLFFIFS